MTFDPELKKALQLLPDKEKDKLIFTTNCVQVDY